MPEWKKDENGSGTHRQEPAVYFGYRRSLPYDIKCVMTVTYDPEILRFVVRGAITWNRKWKEDVTAISQQLFHLEDQSMVGGQRMAEILMKEYMSYRDEIGWAPSMGSESN